jgi:hypothetical protein
MKMSANHRKDTPPVLAFFLLGAGLACEATAAWLARIDLAGFVEQQITRAHGAISAETSAWLKNSHFSGGFLGVGVILLGLGALAHFFRPAMRQFIAKLAPVSGTESPRPTALQSWGLALAACLAVFAYFFPTLRSGYFRYDDFEFLCVARDGSFWATLWQPHGDHFLPLIRTLAFLAFKFFGVTAWPYNLWVLLCLGGVLVTGILLLDEMEVSRPAQAVFVALILFWSPWAEMMSGYYILSTFLLVAILGLAAMRFYLRWLHTSRTADVVRLVVCLWLAPLIDVSGCYVIGACGVFLATNLASHYRETGFHPWLDRHRYLLGGLAVVVAVSGGCMLYAYGVTNPGVFLGMAGEGKRTLAQLAGDLAYLFSAGVLLSMVTPFVYARLPVSLLGTLAITVFILWLAFFTAALRLAAKPRRSMLAAILLVVLGACLMVTLGRHPADTMIVRWATKHICPAYIWLCLLWAVSWDTFWQKVREPRRLLFAELTLIALGIFVATQSAFGQLGMAVTFPPFGYPAEIRDARRRRAAIDVLRHQLIGELATHLKGPAIVPTLDGNYLKASYPSLFSYNLSHYQPFFDDLSNRMEFVRNPAMQSWHTDAVRTVPVLRDAVSPAFIRSLNESPALRAFYYAEVPLQAQTWRKNIPPGPPTGHGRGITIASNGTTEIVLRESAWDPETAPRLRLAARFLDGSPPQEIPVTVSFWSERLNADWRGSLVLQGAPDHVAEVDLRQVYAFSLSTRVANLRIILTKPGRYWFRLAEVVTP